MSETTPTPNEEVVKTTPDSEEGTKDDQELEELLKTEDPSDDESLEQKVERLERENARVKKGVAKFFSEKNKNKPEVKQEEKKVIEQPTTTHPQGVSVSPVIKNLYFDRFPEAKEVWDEVEKEAKALNKDPFELYESSSYFKGEAKAKAEAKRIEEESKAKINKPSSDTGSSSKTDLSKVKPEDVEKLSPADKAKWIRLQAEKERADVD